MKISRKWPDEVIKLVNSEQFTLINVFHNKILRHNPPIGIPLKSHCEFCGQAIDYVSVIQINRTGELKQIGCDCATNLLGDSWLYHSSMMNKYKSLHDLIKIDLRIARYADKFKTQLAWIDENFTKINETKLYYKKHALLQFAKILKLGTKELTKLQISYLNSLISEFTTYFQKNPVTKPIVTPPVIQKPPVTQQPVVVNVQLKTRLETIKKEMETRRGWNTSFIDNITTYFGKYNKLTDKQLAAVDNIEKSLNKNKN